MTLGYNGKQTFWNDFNLSRNYYFKQWRKSFAGTAGAGQIISGRELSNSNFTKQQMQEVR